ncbi:MAG: YgjP-like metallopeptidase domain-containing protein [Fusobacterium sp.]
MIIYYHSKDFYNLVTVFMPDWKKRKARLEERGKYLKL